MDDQKRRGGRGSHCRFRSRVHSCDHTGRGRDIDVGVVSLSLGGQSGVGLGGDERSEDGSEGVHCDDLERRKKVGRGSVEEVGGVGCSACSPLAF